MDTLVVKSSDGAATLQVDTDYTAAFDDSGAVVISLSASGSHYDDAALTVSYDKVDPSKVINEDIIGGIDLETGKEKGWKSSIPFHEAGCCSRHDWRAWL